MLGFSLLFTTPLVTNAYMGNGYGGYGMMGYGGSSIMILISLVWLIVGILAAVCLWQQINKK